jgi:ABC-type Fe3+ transport system permease subunit
MLRSFFLEVPRAIMEAARIDGATLRQELVRVVLPLVAPGIAATALICVIFAWNEFFFAVNLTASRAATVPVFLVGFITSEGLFWARLSAAATLACLPVLLAGAGHRLDWPRLRLRGEAASSRAWTAWARGVVRARWAATAAPTASSGLRKATKKESPSVRTTCPFASRMAARMTSW